MTTTLSKNPVHLKRDKILNLIIVENVRTMMSKGNEVNLEGYLVINNAVVCPIFKNLPMFSCDVLGLSPDGKSLILSDYGIGIVIYTQRNGGIDSAIREYNYMQSFTDNPIRISEYEIF